MVNNWNTKTSKDFKFTAKFPKVITHEKRLKEVDKELDHFFEAVGRLSNKTLALLIQLPPSLLAYSRGSRASQRISSKSRQQI